MRFTLVYRGRLPAAGSANTRVADKQRIRRELSPQLAELWKVNPALRAMESYRPVKRGEIVNGRIEGNPRDEHHAYLELGGFQIVCLVQRNSGVACGIEIVFCAAEYLAI